MPELILKLSRKIKFWMHALKRIQSTLSNIYTSSKHFRWWWSQSGQLSAGKMFKHQGIGDRRDFPLSINFMSHEHIFFSFLFFSYFLTSNSNWCKSISYACFCFCPHIAVECFVFHLSTYLPFDGSGNPSKVHDTCGVGFPAAEHFTATI